MPHCDLKFSPTAHIVTRLGTKIKSEFSSFSATLWRRKMLVPLAAAHGLTTGFLPWFITGQPAPGYSPFNQAVLAFSYHHPLIRCWRGASTGTGLKVLHASDLVCSQPYRLLFSNMYPPPLGGEVLLSLWNSNASFHLWSINNSYMPRMSFPYLPNLTIL